MAHAHIPYPYPTLYPTSPARLPTHTWQVVSHQTTSHHVTTYSNSICSVMNHHSLHALHHYPLLTEVFLSGPAFWLAVTRGTFGVAPNLPGGGGGGLLTPRPSACSTRAPERRRSDIRARWLGVRAQNLKTKHGLPIQSRRPGDQGSPSTPKPPRCAQFAALATQKTPSPLRFIFSIKSLSPVRPSFLTYSLASALAPLTIPPLSACMLPTIAPLASGEAPRTLIST